MVSSHKSHLNASLKILNFNFSTLRQELKWLAKQSDWIISLDCYNLSLSPSQCSQPHLIQQFLYNFTGLLASNYSEELHLFFTKASLLVHSYFIDSIHSIYVKLICLRKIITILTLMCLVINSAHSWKTLVSFQVRVEVQRYPRKKTLSEGCGCLGLCGRCWPCPSLGALTHLGCHPQFWGLPSFSNQGESESAGDLAIHEG